MLVCIYTICTYKFASKRMERGKGLEEGDRYTPLCGSQHRWFPFKSSEGKGVNEMNEFQEITDMYVYGGCGVLSAGIYINDLM